MRHRTLLLLTLLLVARLSHADHSCGDSGKGNRRLLYVPPAQGDSAYVATLTLLPGCHYEWQKERGTFTYCIDCNNNDDDIFTFHGVRLPWGQTAILQADTDLVFSRQERGQTHLTILKLRRHWSLCPLWPVCASRY